MPTQQTLKGLGMGIYSIPNDAELIPKQAAQDSIGWISSDGQIELTRGRVVVGNDKIEQGYVQGDGWGYKADGTAIHFIKTDTKIQYLNSTTGLWVDVVSGLTPGKEYTFSNYSSLAGTFIFATGYDGIYKIHTANPSSYISLYDPTKNFKGKSTIITSRMHMWDLENDKSGHYGSYVDFAVYTTVSAEVKTGTSGILAFKAGDAKRNCFGVKITITSGGEVFTDDYLGKLKGSLGGTGTINYTTGEWTVSNAGAGTIDYQWENSNNKGVTDFTKSATRLPAEGFIFRQDEGGGAIQTITIFNGKYYSIKNNSVYELDIETNDLTAKNLLYRKNIGIQYWRSSINTGKGIIFMDTSNIDNPKLTILQQNVYGDNLEPIILAEHFDLSKYLWDSCAMETYGEYVVFSGRDKNSPVNNKLFFYNTRKNTIDIVFYGVKTITTNNGLIYTGDSQTYNIYNILTGFDDDNTEIENYWISKDETYDSESLKKVKRLRLKGLISKEQVLEIYISYDNDNYILIGTILGDGSYVDKREEYSIGSQGIGNSIIGGDKDSILGSFFFAELKIPGPKFRKRTIKIKAVGIGYVSLNLIDDYDVIKFQNKLPAKYRQKQNISIDGKTVNIDSPLITETKSSWEMLKVKWEKLLINWDNL